MHDVDSAQKSNGSIPGAKVKTIGIIGLGSIGLRHANNLIGMGHEVIAYDPDRERSKKFHWRENIDLLVKDSEAVIIASPTDKHYNHILDCVADLRPFLVEKPILRTYEEKEKALPLDYYFKRIPHMVGYNLRFHGCVKKAKEWIDRIGDIDWANFTLGQFSEKPPYLRDGVILNWSHEIDLALYLLGPAKVLASSTRVVGGKDDLTDIILEHEGSNFPIRSTIHLDYITTPEIRQFIIVGNLGSIIADLKARQAWLRDSDGYILEHFEDTETWNDNYIEEMRAFLDRIDGKETLGCTAEEALKVLDICLKVRKQAGLT